MKIRLSSDLLTAILFLALGFFVLIYGTVHYTLGTPSRMGAGFFPALVSIGLIFIGCLLLLQTYLSEDEEVGTIDIRAVLFVLAGTLLFGLLIERAGLLVASATLVIFARIADRDFSVVETVVLAAVLFALTASLFYYGLGMPLHMLPF